MSECNRFETVFVTVGTTTFDQLVSCVLSDSVLKVLKAKGCRKLIAQTGNTALDLTVVQSIKDIDIETFAYKDSILDDIKRADLVIGHAGAGTTLDVLRNDKVLLVVVNKALMNNHQSELADKLSEEGYLYQCTPESLVDCLLFVDKSKIKPFPQPNLNTFSDFLDSELS